MNFFAHPAALVESDRIGNGTRIWAFSHVLPGAAIGGDCNICDHVFIENDVVIGDRVTIKSGVQLWDGVVLENDVFVGPNATFTNDPFPRSKKHLSQYPRTIVRSRASIGANATILPGLTIGPGAMVGAGSVVTRSVPANAVVTGNPARIVRYTDDDFKRPSLPETIGEIPQIRVRGARLLRIPTITDMRGSLVAREVGKGLPFEPKRVFTVFDVPTKEVRGEHAHRKCHQLLICVRGRVTSLCDDGQSRQGFVLDSPELALYVPPLLWGTQYGYSPDAILVVLASEPYDADDYIRSYDTFLEELSRPQL